MTLTINDTTMTSDQTPHTARHAPSRNGWEVSWLPGRALDRNSAITAMILADTAADQRVREDAPALATHPELGRRTRSHRSRGSRSRVPASRRPRPGVRIRRRTARPGGCRLTSETDAQDR